MAVSINFNRQFQFVAVEFDDKFINGYLSVEFDSEYFSFDLLPERYFGKRGVVA